MDIIFIKNELRLILKYIKFNYSIKNLNTIDDSLNLSMYFRISLDYANDVVLKCYIKCDAIKGNYILNIKPSDYDYNNYTKYSIVKLKFIIEDYTKNIYLDNKSNEISVLLV